MANEKSSLEEFLAKVPEELRSEFQSVVDRERTSASQTARRNAESALASDEKFLASLEPKFKEKFEKEKNLTFEQKQDEAKRALDDREKSIRLKENEMSVREALLSEGYGLSSEDINQAVKLIVDENPNSTKEKLEAFTKMLKPMADKMAKAEIEKQLKSFKNPQYANDKDKETKIDYKSEYKLAFDRHDYRRMAEVARLAAENNQSIK